MQNRSGDDVRPCYAFAVPHFCHTVDKYCCHVDGHYDVLLSTLYRANRLPRQQTLDVPPRQLILAEPAFSPRWDMASLALWDSESGLPIREATEAFIMASAFRLRDSGRVIALAFLHCLRCASVLKSSRFDVDIDSLLLLVASMISAERFL